MRHPAIPLLVPTLLLGLAACAPPPLTGPEFSPLIAPIGAGVGLPPPRPVSTTPVTGTFAPEPAGPPIIEEALSEAPGNMILPPTNAPLNPSISEAVDAAGGPSRPFEAPPPGAGPVGGAAGGFPLGEPLTDQPFGTVPGGPLPPPNFRGSTLGAESPDTFDESRVPAAPAPVAPSAPGAPAAVSVTPISASSAMVSAVASPRPAGISDEQDFAAVSTRETIESDAARLVRLRAERLEVAPEPVPQRPADGAPDVVRYALATANAVGERAYRRSSLRSAARLGDACARFASADRAQEAFLAAGGPARDRHDLDPDGDGYACDWDPAPFRRGRT